MSYNPGMLHMLIPSFRSTTVRRKSEESLNSRSSPAGDYNTAAGDSTYSGGGPQRGGNYTPVQQTSYHPYRR